MGDEIEITTWPKHQNMFYKITSSALVVEIKASGFAAIGLAKKPGKTCDYWIVIGDHNRRSWIKKEDDRSKQIETPNILSLTQYRKFWVTWYGDSIQFGNAGDTKPLLTYSLSIPEMQFVTFSQIGETNPVNWRFELPPPRQNKAQREVEGGSVEWIASDNQLPDGALIGGYENENLYIIRAGHRGSVTPGKFVPSQGVGYVSWGGQAIEKNVFEVLCGYNVLWVPTTGDRIPVGAIVGGNSEDREERLYIGRALHKGHLIPGKVQPSHKVCYIPFEEREIGKKNFEILVNPSSSLHKQCVHRFMIPEVHVESADDSDRDEDNQSDFSDHIIEQAYVF